MSSEAPRWALPAAAWSAYSGDPILYANEDGVPDATQRAIEEVNATHAYVLAPPDLISDDALSALDVEWTRVAGETPQAHAVEVAEFRDESREFGWGIHGRDDLGYYNFVLVNPGEWEHAVSATNLQWGKAGPILLVHEDGDLPAVTENYAWQTQPAWYATPLEGPFNHLFAMGSTEEVSRVSQGRLDYAVEITQYRDQGAGLSPLESVAAVWATFSLLGATFVFAHARHRLPEMNSWTKMVWPLLTLLLGPFGFGLYRLAYRGRQVVETDQGPRVMRPYWLRAATATAMGVGFAASTMIAAAFLLNYFGIPMFVLDGPLFWLGNAMTVLIAVVYVVAFLVSWLVFHVPMLRDSQGLDTGVALRKGAKIVAVSMTSVSIGMMGGMWVLMMLNLEMMPEDDNVLWFGVMAFATLLGFLIATPVNGLLVRRDLKRVVRCERPQSSDVPSRPCCLPDRSWRRRSRPRTGLSTGPPGGTATHRLRRLDGHDDDDSPRRRYRLRDRDGVHPERLHGDQRTHPCGCSDTRQRLGSRRGAPRGHGHPPSHRRRGAADGTGFAPGRDPG